jgi:pyridoxal phosphate enzyme (YggS family)
MMRERVEAIQRQISENAITAGRSPENIRLLAVSKTHDAAKIRDAHALGLRDFGENYADELSTKAEQLQNLRDLRLVFIGQLQSNKIQSIVRHAHEIQSVASEKHARYIERYAAELGKSAYPVWIVVNAGDEASKQGVTFESLPTLAAFIKEECPHLSLQGIMASPPSTFSDDSWKKSGQRSIPELYKQLRLAADQTGLGKLSLGMSGDLALAIAAGSDCVRIGTAIFGRREA